MRWITKSCFCLICRANHKPIFMLSSPIQSSQSETLCLPLLVVYERSPLHSVSALDSTPDEERTCSAAIHSQSKSHVSVSRSESGTRTRSGVRARSSLPRDHHKD